MTGANPVTLPGYVVAGLLDYLNRSREHQVAHEFDRQTDVLVEMSGYLRSALIAENFQLTQETHR